MAGREGFQSTYVAANATRPTAARPNETVESVPVAEAASRSFAAEAGQRPSGVQASFKVPALPRVSAPVNVPTTVPTAARPRLETRTTSRVFEGGGASWRGVTTAGAGGGLRHDGGDLRGRDDLGGPRGLGCGRRGERHVLGFTFADAHFDARELSARAEGDDVRAGVHEAWAREGRTGHVLPVDQDHHVRRKVGRELQHERPETRSQLGGETVGLSSCIVRFLRLVLADRQPRDAEQHLARFDELAARGIGATELERRDGRGDEGVRGAELLEPTRLVSALAEGLAFFEELEGVLGVDRGGLVGTGLFGVSEEQGERKKKG